jgi:hypothetical protein
VTEPAICDNIYRTEIGYKTLVDEGRVKEKVESVGEEDSANKALHPQFVPGHAILAL